MKKKKKQQKHRTKNIEDGDRIMMFIMMSEEKTVYIAQIYFLTYYAHFLFVFVLDSCECYIHEHI